jgi:hypothetical protein
MNMPARFTSNGLKLAVLALALCGASGAIAAPTSTSAQSSGTVITPIAIAKSADLAFGKFAAGTGGTVTVSTSGARTSTGVTVIASSTTTAAKFDVTGDKGATYAITIPASATLTSGADTMTFALVSDLTGVGAITGTATSGALDGTTGKQSIYVGGVLTVAANQAAGSYAGTLSVGVEYN